MTWVLFLFLNLAFNSAEKDNKSARLSQSFIVFFLIRQRRVLYLFFQGAANVQISIGTVYWSSNYSAVFHTLDSTLASIGGVSFDVPYAFDFDVLRPECVV